MGVALIEVAAGEGRPAVNLERLRVFLGWAIAVAWLASLVLDAIVPTYDPPVTIHLAMMLVAGALFGPTLAGRGGSS